ncbi:hypothetical protein ACP70R_038184 [Stipagrostis hirtigluma subsp. patula]
MEDLEDGDSSSLQDLPNGARFRILAVHMGAHHGFRPLATHARQATEFSVELASFEGRNATLAAFNLKVRVENHRVLRPRCYHGGEVVVSYSCRHCMGPSATLQSAGEGTDKVYSGAMIQDWRRHLASDWQKGIARIMVQMKVLHDDKGHWERWKV